MQPTEVNRYIEVNRNLVLVCFCPSLPKMTCLLGLIFPAAPFYTTQYVKKHAGLPTGTFPLTLSCPAHVYNVWIPCQHKLYISNQPCKPFLGVSQLCVVGDINLFKLFFPSLSYP